MSQHKDNLWQLREMGLEIPEANVDWNRPVVEQDISYLLDHYPFLEIICMEAEAEAFALSEPEVHTAENSGWKIHYWGDRIKSSPGIKLFGQGAPDDDDSSSGTVVQQAVDTACAMLWLAKQKAWQSFEIVFGHPLMQWAAWMAAEELELKLENYQPSDDDLKKRERVKRELRGLTRHFSSSKGYQPK